ncbi:MAG TPA: 2Fe-2S iron-sulfur cluster-binding protein, partial [Rhizobium sp.]|nr:2Fe-2S iron-sulfur cluster-binding protein [Rhizobium sp.]
MSSHRLSSGGRIDRSKTVAFRFDGQDLTGHPGDTLASALLANGVQLVGRSFKYHRPRGILTAGAAEPNALVTTGMGGRIEANSRATTIELYDGLTARSQNRWPSLAFDVGAVNSLLSPFLSAGFYYKTFMWPAAFWEKVYEPLIRKAAGLGKASYEADPDSYEKCWAHCDLLVIGAGPSGLAAALTAGRAGARVLLADEGFALGGNLLAEKNPALDTILNELENLPNVQCLPRTTVIGWYDDNVFGAVERVQKHVATPDARRPVERLWRIIARQAILATGAEERPLVFGGNDIPGVMMAGAMRSYLNRQAIAPGKRTVVFTTNQSGYQTAADLEAAGIEVAAIVDSRANSGEGWKGRAQMLTGARVIDAHGGRQLRRVTIATSSGNRDIEADALAMSGGWSPIIHLACHRGAKPIWSEKHAAFLAPERQEGVTIAGVAAGLASTEACLGDGAGKAVEALTAIGFTRVDPAFAPVEDRRQAASPLWFVKGGKGKAFVDYQNDVNLKDLGLAVREGYGDVELAKRYTTNGMATDQGKLSNINAIGI